MSGFCDSQRIYEKLSSLFKHSPFLLVPHTPEKKNWWAKLFWRLKPVFLRLEISRGTTIAAKIDQAVVDLKLEVKWELILTHYHCHGRGSITRSDDLKVNALSIC